MAHDLNQNEDARRDVLVNSPVIAIVGWSADPMVTSHEIGDYLAEQGYTVYAVNPMVDKSETDAEVYDSLKDVPEPIDIVDVFRKSDYLEQVVDEAIAVGAKTVWAQEGITNENARLKALGAGLNYAENICIRNEHRRLFKGMVEG
jgi:predicted CoA-binding protein